MNIYSKLLPFCMLLCMVIFSSSCTYRLVDYTAISTKNVSLNVDRDKGVNTKGSKSYFLGIGMNLDDAIDIALENAGKKYDMLIDGVVSYSTYPFVNVVKVTGLAVSSKDLMMSMGEQEYDDWLKTQNVTYAKMD